MQLAAIAFQTTPYALLLTDEKGNILLVNETFSELTGYTQEEIAGKNPRVLSSGRHDAAFYQQMWSELNTVGTWQGEIWNRRKSGELFLEYISIRSVKDGQGHVRFFTAAFIDFTEQKKVQEKNAYHAYHDFLTGLPNRLLFQRKAEAEIEQARQENGRFAILFLDLDGFKQVNDTYGHEAGDLLIQAVAKRLSQHFPEEVTVSRMSGDEFTILLPRISSRADAKQAAAGIADRMLAPFPIFGYEITVSASIGLSLYPDDGPDLRSLISAADHAMYRSKGRALDSRGEEQAFESRSE